MANNSTKRRLGRIRRRKSIRKRISGDASRPRLSVFRSLRHIYAQVIDDLDGTTLVAASTMDKDVAAEVGELGKKDAAKVVGRVLAERAVAKEIGKVVFDRNGYKYHGRVRSLAEGAREAGLDF
jgi:large subunit ribosomal protein L18